MSITPLIPAPRLAQALEIKNKIYLKREDLHPLGSHKGRSIPLMLEWYHKQGVRDFVISSSGNAALAAGLYIKKHNQKNKKGLIKLNILVGQRIAIEKLKILKKISNKNITVTQVPNPKQLAFKLDKNKKAHWLRQSTDDIALIGYEKLAKELAKIKNLQAVFIPTSSGTTAVGIHQGFKKININPQIHIIQTTACHPFVKSEKPTTKISLANAIVDIVGHRNKEIQNLVRKTKGNCWVADDQEIKNAIKLFKENTNLKISANSALSLVGLRQALESKKKISGSIVLLITGK